MAIPLALYHFKNVHSDYLLIAAVASFYVFTSRRWARKIFLPPSPPSEPILGHLRLEPPEFQWKTFSEWGKTVG